MGEERLRGGSPSSKGKEKVGEGEKGKPAFSGEGRTWARVVQGGMRRAVWSSPKVTEEEVGELQQFFSTVLDLPVNTVAETRRLWEGKSILVRSLGRRVSADAVKREFRVRLKLAVDPEVFPLAEDHLMIRFGKEQECSLALTEGPWIVAGQLLAVEPWRPRFNPLRRPVTKAAVWLRLPSLPAEFWEPSAIRSIAARAGRPLSIDEVTDNLTKMGFARVKIEIDSVWPLTPGVLIRDDGEPYWQQYQYENLSVVCYQCGLVGHLDDDCPHRGPVRGKDDSGEGSSRGQRPRLGPWVVASRSWLPWEPTSSGGPSSRNGSSPDSGPGSSRPGSNAMPSTPVAATASPPTTSDEADGWRKPKRVARRSNLSHDLRASPSSTERELELLGGFPSRMDAQASAPEAVERAMIDPDAVVLKRGRSPSPGARERELQIVAVRRKELRTPRKVRRQTQGRTVPALPAPSSLECQVGSTGPCMSSKASGTEGGTASTSKPEGSGLVNVHVGVLEEWRPGDKAKKGKTALLSGSKREEGKKEGQKEGRGSDREGPGSSQGRCLKAGQLGGNYTAEGRGGLCGVELGVEEGNERERECNRGLEDGGTSVKVNPGRVSPKVNEGRKQGAGCCCGTETDPRGGTGRGLEGKKGLTGVPGGVRKPQADSPRLGGLVRGGGKTGRKGSGGGGRTQGGSRCGEGSGGGSADSKGSPGSAAAWRRERSRSPAGRSRRLFSGDTPTEPDGGKTGRPALRHGEFVSKIQKAVAAKGDISTGTVEEGSQESPDDQPL